MFDAESLPLLLNALWYLNIAMENHMFLMGKTWENMVKHRTFMGHLYHSYVKNHHRLPPLPQEIWLDRLQRLRSMTMTPALAFEWLKILYPTLGEHGWLIPPKKWFL